MRNVFILSVILSCNLALAETAGPPVPLERAHSHNDYTRTRPLLDALDCGFCSVEADIYLIDGKLLVAHDRRDASPNRTLRGMYLDPLLERVKKNGGRVYPGGPTVTLLIDIKDHAEKTWTALRAVLEDYREMLTVYSKDSTEPGAVSIILSGNRPRAMLEEESPRLAAMDGRLPDLESDASPHLIPLVSESWTSVFKWKGIGRISKPEFRELRELCDLAHSQGRRIRFWGLPLAPLMWESLYDAGVDLLNADQVEKLRDLLLAKEKEQAPPPEEKE